MATGVVGESELVQVNQQKAMLGAFLLHGLLEHAREAQVELGRID